MHRRFSLQVRPLVGVIALLFAAGCNNQNKPVEAASATNQASYAEAYPEKVQSSTEAVAIAETETKTTIGEFPSYPEQVKKTDYTEVKKVVELADEAGKSKSYADAAEENAKVAEFFAEEKDPLNRQVGGSSRYSSKEKGATDEVADAGASGAIFGLDKGVTKQLEERSKKSSDAQRYIEDHEESLGKANQETLSKQAEAISRASYLVYVAGPKEKARLEALVSEAGSVKSTLEKKIEEQKQIDADAGASPKQKKTAKARLATYEEALGKVDGVEAQAKEALKDIEKRHQELKDAYEQAFKELLKALDAKAEAEPAKKATAS
jgi:hypothetical protein